MDFLGKTSAEVPTTAPRPPPTRSFQTAGQLLQTTVKDGQKWKQPVKDSAGLLKIIEQIIPAESVLLFCDTKRNCERTCEWVAQFFSDHPRKEAFKRLRFSDKIMLLNDLLDEVGGDKANMCPVLQRCIPYGLAYHHSDLTGDERRLIEEAFSAGVLCLIACTSTLAAGVNLPAHKSLEANDPTSRTVGRAGRAGLASKGSSLLMCSRTDWARLEADVLRPTLLVRSRLLSNDCYGLKALLLNLIGLKLASSIDSCCELIDANSFLAVESSDKANNNNNNNSTSNIRDHVLAIVERLTALGLVETDNKTSDLGVTPFGHACLNGQIEAENSAAVYASLRIAEQMLVLDSFLHLIYICVPLELVEDFVRMRSGSSAPTDDLNDVNSLKVDWQFIFDQYLKLTESQQRLADYFGISESFLVGRIRGKRRANGSLKKTQSSSGHGLLKPAEQTPDASSVARFYLALVLNALKQQESAVLAAREFSLSRGYVQQLLSQVTAFSGCLSRFCETLSSHEQGQDFPIRSTTLSLASAHSLQVAATYSTTCGGRFWALQRLLPDFTRELQTFLLGDLAALIDIPGVKLGRARQLYKAGYSSLQQLSRTDVETLCSKIENLPRKVAKSIISNSQRLLKERVEDMLADVAAVAQGPVVSSSSSSFGSSFLF